MKQRINLSVALLIATTNIITSSAEVYPVVNSDGVTIYYGVNPDNRSVYVTNEYGKTIYDEDETIVRSYSGNVVIPSGVCIPQTVISYSVLSGQWNSNYNSSAVDGYSYTCQSPGANGSTILRINFKTSGSITFACASNGENGYDYLNIGHIDSKCTRTSYYETLKLNSGVTKYFTFTPGDTEEHYVEFCYSKDGSEDTAPDNATVYISSIDSVNEELPVTNISSHAFYQCSDLASVTIPNSVTSIGYNSFSCCTSLTSINIPESVKEIGSFAFECCNSLNKVNISDIIAWCGINFSCRESNPLYNAHNLYLNGEKVDVLEIPETVTSIGDYAFAGCCYISSVTIPNTVTSIGNEAFYGCSKLSTMTIPVSVTEIGNYSFFRCEGLTSVTIPTSITSIDDGTFSGCSGLLSIEIPETVTTIGYAAFSWCRSLTSLTIPASVTSIGNYAFQECGGLTSIICKIENPYEISVGSNIFEYVDKSNCTLYVPQGSKELYAHADQWKDFENIVEMEPEPTTKNNADVNGDGVIDIRDVNAVIEAILAE